MNMKKSLSLMVSLVLILVLVGCGSDQETDELMGEEFTLIGDLADVTNGEAVRGVVTRGLVAGVAQSKFEDGMYSLRATFANLPAPAKEGDFQTQSLGFQANPKLPAGR